MLDFNKFIENSSKFNIDEEGYKECSKRITEYTEMLHHTIGISTENGELLDALKKAIYYNKPLDLANVSEEVGDIFWYASQLLALVSKMTGVSPNEILDINTRKLTARYDQKFSEASAIDRDLEVERRILEDGVNK